MVSLPSAHYFPAQLCLNFSKDDTYRILQTLFLEMQAIFSQAKFSMIQKFDPKQEEAVPSPHIILSSNNSYGPILSQCYPGLINRIHQQITTTNELTPTDVQMRGMTGSIDSSCITMPLCSLQGSYVKAPLNCEDKNDACNENNSLLNIKFHAEQTKKNNC